MNAWPRFVWETKKVAAKTIDDSNRYKIYVSELLEISESLLNHKLTTVYIFLTGIAPFKDEFEWTDVANDYSNDWI